MNGWHIIKGVEAYVENGKVIRGVHRGKTVYPYIACKSGGWDNASGMLTVNELRGRINRNTAKWA